MRSKSNIVDGDAPTATAPGSAAPFPAQEIGRYRIESLLGRGGMGSVYAAFDPELERRVALKVLSGDRGERVTRERLLREARAMARLRHPNVITVFEVGSAGEHDYVAMELVDGSDLYDWLRRARPSHREIVTAFVQAGEGLIAAHAVGLIHRDFKPQNVLRWRDGTVEVSDFGLAREISEAAPPEPPSMRNTPTPLAQLTMTGSVVGTPAYMAPEQAEGAPAGAAADQFSFCVALWEAFAGELPFRGSRKQIHAAMLRGPAALDATRIPRSLRSLLRRGLDPDPARRWPSMIDVVRRLERYARRRTLVFGLAGAIVSTFAAIGLVAARAPTNPCARPRLDVGQAWPIARRVGLIARGQESAVRSIDGDLRTWTGVRANACKLEPARRVPALACLDGVMGRIDGVADAVARVPQPGIAIEELLIDPHMCEQPTPPRLVPRLGPGYRAVITRRLGESQNPEPLTQAVIDRLVAGAGDDPCGAAAATWYGGLFLANSLVAGRATLARAATFADACDDDYERFQVTWTAAAFELRQPLSDEALRALEHVEAAARRLGEAQALADADRFKAERARAEGRIDDMIAVDTSVMQRYRARGVVVSYLHVAQNVFRARTLRGRPEDVSAAAPLLDEMHAVAIDGRAAEDPLVTNVDYLRAGWLHANGDITGADAIYDRLNRRVAIQDAIQVHGRVVDAAGAPVAGATVTSGVGFDGDALEAALALPEHIATMRRAITDHDGRFALPESVSDGEIIAQLGARRSRPHPIADGLEIALEDTTRIEGRVVLHGAPAFDVRITATDESLPATSQYVLAATVHADGSFVFEGVPRGSFRIDANADETASTRIATKLVEVGAAPVTGVELALPQPQHTITVLIRSTSGDAVPRARAWAITGRVAASTYAQLRQLSAVGELTNAGALPDHAPDAVRARSRSGDLVATLHAERGDGSICVLGLPIDDSRETAARVEAQAAKVPTVCIPVAPSEDVVVVEVPPFPRLE